MLLQYVIYRCNVSHIAAICHISLQCVTYRCNVPHIAAICHISLQYATYRSNMSYRSRYVKLGQNLSIQNENNVLKKRRPIRNDKLKVNSAIGYVFR